MKEQLVTERKKLLTTIEKLLEGPMIFLGFIWLGLLVIELIWVQINHWIMQALPSGVFL